MDAARSSALSDAIASDVVAGLKASRADIKATAGVPGLMLAWFVGKLVAMGPWLFRLIMARAWAAIRAIPIGEAWDFLSGFGDGPRLAKAGPPYEVKRSGAGYAIELAGMPWGAFGDEATARAICGMLNAGARFT